RLAARRCPLIGRDGGVALDQTNACERDRQLLGDELRLHGEDTQAQLALAGVRRDGAVGRDRDPRVELRRIDVRHARAELPLRESGSLDDRRAAEADDQRARRLQKITPRESCAPQRVDGVACHTPRSFAYRLIALSMRACVKQRHSTPDSARWTSASVAFGLPSTNAFAVRMTPLRQKPHWAACSSMNAC